VEKGRVVILGRVLKVEQLAIAIYMKCCHSALILKVA